MGPKAGPARVQVCARPAADLRRHPWVLADPRLLDAAAWFHGGGDGCAVVSALALSSASAPGNPLLTSLQLAVFRPAPVYPAAHLRLPVPVAHAINAKFHPGRAMRRASGIGSSHSAQWVRLHPPARGGLSAVPIRPIWMLRSVRLPRHHAPIRLPCHGLLLLCSSLIWGPQTACHGPAADIHAKPGLPLSECNKWGACANIQGSQAEAMRRRIIARNATAPPAQQKNTPIRGVQLLGIGL